MPGTAGVTIDQAPNGVPLVNIAAPSAAGVSHNRYEHFNVGPNGLLLNNSAGPVNTQLGGYIAGNTNLSTDPARLILNEVTGTRPSLLNGYLEVAGPQAEVVVANPSGITCRGCGFINTPQATLSTGTPFFGGDDALAGFTVANGFLRIEGTGLNASNLERLALYGRVLRINAALYAQELDVVTGANHIDVDAGAQTGAITPLGTAAALSSYGLDSSALGGMYANTIRLVGTEAGVGMRLAGPVAAQTGDLEITNDGNVRLARVSTPTDLLVNASGYLWLMDNVSVGGIADLHATQELALTHQGQLTSSAATGLFAGSLRAASGSAIGVYGDLTINAGQQQYEGSVGTAGWLTINGDVIENSGHLAAAQGLTLSADGLLNAGEISVRDGALLLDVASYLDNSGVLQGTAALTITAADVSPLRVSNVGGQLLSNGEIVMNLAGGTFVNGAFADGDLAGVSGLVKTIANLRIESVGAFENSAGNVLVGDEFILNGGSFGNDGGTIEIVRGDLDITLAGIFDNSNGVLIYGGDTLVLSAEALYNNAGQIDLAPGNASLMFDGLFDNSAGLLRQGGTGDGGLTLAAGALNNSGGALASAGTLAVQLSPMPLSGNDGLNGVLNNSDGLLQGNTALLINTAALNNVAGQLRSNGAIEIDLSGGVIANSVPVNGELNNNNGLIATAGSITLAHVSALQNNGGTVNAGNALSIFADSIQNNAGQIELSLGELRIDLAGDFDNSNGSLASGGDTLILNAGALNNSGGQLVGAGAVVVQLGSDSLSGAALNNSAGLLQGGNALTITAAGLNNAGGQVLSNGPMAVDLRGGDVINGAGLIQILGGLSFDHVGAFDNTQGTVLAGNGFTLHADSATNSAGAIEVAAGAVNITLADDFDNSDGFFVHGASDSFSLSADALRNDFGVLMSAGHFSLQQNSGVFDTVLENSFGFMQGNAGISVAGYGVNNAGGKLLSNGSIAMNLFGSDLNNGLALFGFLSDGTADIRGGLIKTIGGIHLINAGIVDNSGGYLSIGNGFSLDAGMLQNSGGRIEISDGETNILLAGNFDNSAGVFLRGGSGELKIGADTLHNDGGYIGMQEGAANITLAGIFDNRSGTFLHEENGTVTLNADALDNRYGVFIAKDIFSLQQSSDFHGNAIENSWGSLQANRGIFVVGAGLNNSDGSMYSGSTFDVNLLGGTLNNRAGVIDVVGTATVSHTDIFDNHAGSFQAGNGFFMNGVMFNNDAGKVIVINGHAYIDLSGEFSNEGGLFGHNENTHAPRFSRSRKFYLRAGSLDNRGGRIEVTARHSDVIVAGSFDNTDGAFVHEGESLDFGAETLNNFQGILAGSGTVTLDLHGTDTLNPSLDNREGLLHGNAGLTISGIGLTNADGDLQSDGAINLDLGSGALNNGSNGRILAVGDLTINAAFGVNNSAFGVADISGGIFSGGTINLNLGSGALDNSSGGRIQAFDAISIDSGSLNNAGGQILSGAVDADGNLLGYGSVTLNLGYGTLDNSSGLIQSTGNLAISNVSVLNNSAGVLFAGSALGVEADTLLTVGGRLESLDDLSVHVRALGYDATSKLIAADVLHLWLPEIRTLPMAMLSAGGELHLQSDNDIVVDGWDLAVPGSLRLTAANDIALAATTTGGLGNVVISGNTLSVAQDARLLAGNNLLIDVSGDLVNTGIIETIYDIYVANSANLINGNDAYEASILSHWGDITLFADTAIYNNGSIIQATN
ncbi:MAG: filamentous hemagglutinin N-terminal domain-containing protein, partial [Pseudomonadota bacterium]